jgi:hypothetical protein
MIKRRKKKIIRLKNPDWKINDGEKLPEDYIPHQTISNKLIRNLKEAIYASDVASLSDAITLWNQGSHCFDCYNREKPGEPTPYNRCTCERCFECSSRHCICSLGEISDFTPYELKKNYEDTAKVAWEFVKLAFSNYQIEDFKKLNLLPNYERGCADYVFEDIMESKSLRKPSYPKYKKIAKELFRL